MMIEFALDALRDTPPQPEQTEFDAHKEEEGQEHATSFMITIDYSTRATEGTNEDGEAPQSARASEASAAASAMERGHTHRGERGNMLPVANLQGLNGDDLAERFRVLGK